jgi:hypothetical protein
MQRLNLTEEEGGIVDFSDEEEAGATEPVECALLGKVLSPAILHANTIRAAMTPAWGNPHGLKIRSIGDRGDNLFVVEFGSKVDMDRVLAGAPWIAGKHALILKEYDEKLKPSEIRFDSMDMWARILNLPLGWMNQHRGSRAMRLLGEVKQMDVDADGKASGAFLRARITMSLDKPLKRGVLLRMARDSEPEWFDSQYERLPFFCFSCGVIGHGGLGCDKPVVRNAQGKLPYDRDVPLGAPEDRRSGARKFRALWRQQRNLSALAPLQIIVLLALHLADRDAMWSSRGRRIVVYRQMILMVERRKMSKCCPLEEMCT